MQFSHNLIEVFTDLTTRLHYGCKLCNRYQFLRTLIRTKLTARRLLAKFPAGFKLGCQLREPLISQRKEIEGGGQTGQVMLNIVARQLINNTYAHVRTQRQICSHIQPLEQSNN